MDPFQDPETESENGGCHLLDFCGSGFVCAKPVPRNCLQTDGDYGSVSPANLVFLIVIFILLEKVFTLSIIVSQLEEKVTVLSSEVALRSHSANRGIGIVEEEEKELYEETAAAREVQGELEETECQKGKKV